MKEKVLIFGGGYLGGRISQELGYDLVPRKEIDATNPHSIAARLDKTKPDVVINCVGKTGGPGEIGIDWCETHRVESVESNVVSAVNLSLESAKRGIYFVHMSSGCIYAGDNNGKGFSEKDEPNYYGPQFYAKTKIDSERILSNFPGLILRIRMPIDDRPNARNLIDKLKGYSKVIDIQNSMTTVPHMITALENLIEQKKEGIYNVVNPGTISAAEIMQGYRKIVDYNHNFEVFSLKELDSITKGKRSNCILNGEKLERENIMLPEIHEAVRECLVKYKHNVL